jgi:hypothetical protein
MYEHDLRAQHAGRGQLRERHDDLRGAALALSWETPLTRSVSCGHEPQPRKRRELDSHPNSIPWTPPGSRSNERHIRRRQREVTDQLITGDLRERPQLLVLLPGEHLLRHPDHLRHAGTNQTERSGSDPLPEGGSCLIADQRHIRWILSQGYGDPKLRLEGPVPTYRFVCGPAYTPTFVLASCTLTSTPTPTHTADLGIGRRDDRGRLLPADVPHLA